MRSPVRMGSDGWVAFVVSSSSASVVSELARFVTGPAGSCQVTEPKRSDRMFKVFAFLTKKDIETQAFTNDYENNHVPLVILERTGGTPPERN